MLKGVFASGCMASIPRILKKAGQKRVQTKAQQSRRKYWISEVCFQKYAEQAQGFECFIVYVVIVLKLVRFFFGGLFYRAVMKITFSGEGTRNTPN
jgi:hypothetical protein